MSSAIFDPVNNNHHVQELPAAVLFDSVRVAERSLDWSCFLRDLLRPPSKPSFGRAFFSTGIDQGF